MLTISLHSGIVFRVDKLTTQDIDKEGGKILIDTQELEKRIMESGKKKSYIASALGISIQSLRLKLNNSNEFKLSEVNALCDILGITKASDKEKIFFKK